MKSRVSFTVINGVLSILACCAILCSPLRACGQKPFYLHNGDRVLFYGDSITEQRFYTQFAETYVVTRFPKLRVTFTNSGWGGDRVTGGGGGPIDLRLDRDALPYKPTVMTVMLAMNDGSYRAFDDAIFGTYTNGYRHIVQKMRTALPELRMTLIQPSPYDDITRKPFFNPGYNSVLIRYGDFVRQLAEQNKLDVADLNTPVVSMLKRAFESDSALAQKIIPDRVHPGPGGHLIMAEALLEAWNAPSLVTEVAIDLGSRSVHADNTKVSGLQTGSTLLWTQTDEALPFPIDTKDPAVALAVQSSDLVAALDREILKVTGLTASRYTLKIDGDTVGTFGSDQLATGINLATLDTPMTKQAQAVHLLTVHHSQIHYMRWRNWQVPLASEDSAAMAKALAGMDALEASVVKKQIAAAQPKPHQYTLTPG